LEEQLTTFSQKRDSIEKLIFEKEMKISKKIAEVESGLTNFNNLARKIQLVPSTARHAKGLDFQISFSSHSPDLDIEEIKKTIKPNLEQLKQELSKSTVSFQDESLTIQENIDRREENISDKKDEISALQSRINRLDSEYKKQKERNKDEIHQIELETETLRREIAILKDSSSESLNKSQKSLEVLAREYEILKDKYANEETEMSNCLIQLLESLASHKTFISENLAALNKYYTQTRDNLQAVQL